MSYSQYRAHSTELLTTGKTTGGPDYQSEEILAYARMNQTRKDRLDKTVLLQPALLQALQSISGTQHWLLITESWCGDASQSVPVIAAMAAQNPAIRLELFLRDAHLPLMDAYLQNGKSRSIPKLIAVDAAGHELWNWGPRPAEAQLLWDELRQKQAPFAEASEALHGWYAKDKTQSLQAEIATLITAAAQKSV